jgi:hypothetical protein
LKVTTTEVRAIAEFREQKIEDEVLDAGVLSRMKDGVVVEHV